MTRLQREDGDEEQSDQEVQLQQGRNDDQGVQLPEDRREGREGQEDGEGSDHSLPQRGLLQGQSDEENEESDQDFSDQDSLSDEDDEEQPRQGALRAERGGEEREQSVQEAGLGEQLQNHRDGQQVIEDGRVLQRYHLPLQSSPSASSPGTPFPAGDGELEELYRKIREYWTLSAATRAFSAATESQNGAVIFQTDTLFILGRDGTTAKCHVSYDNHGSEHYLSGNLPEEFDFHNGQRTSSFRVATIHGSHLNSHTLATIKLVTLKGIIPISTVSAEWISVDQEPQLDDELAAKHKISVPKEVDTSLRLILGAGQLVNHPRPTFIPPRLREEQPGLVLFKSQLSGLVIAGGLFTN